MSNSAVEYYAGQYGIEAEALGAMAMPADIYSAGERQPIDIHTLQGNDSVHLDGMANAVVNRMHGQASMTIGAMRTNGDIGDDVRNEFSTMSTADRRNAVADRLGRVLFPKAMKTGKLLSVSMELITPNELPATLIDRLAQPEPAVEGVERLQRYDSVHRILARVKTGSRVGSLACAVIMRPQVEPSMDGPVPIQMMRSKTSFDRYPKAELTAESLRQASVAAALRLQAARMLSSPVKHLENL